jgi:hypothetical protein
MALVVGGITGLFVGTVLLLAWRRRAGGHVNEAVLLLELRRKGYRGKHPGERSTLDSYSTVVFHAEHSTNHGEQSNKDKNRNGD